MTSFSLLKTQIALRSHRRWLNQFLSTTRYHATALHTRAPGSRDHGLCCSSRPLASQPFNSGSIPVASFATKRLKLAKQARSVQEAEGNIAALRAIRKAVVEHDVKTIVRIYTSFNDKSGVLKGELRKIAQCLHYCLRRATREKDAEKRREDTDEIVAFAERLVKDVKEGNIDPQHQAHLHLLGIFKESGARDAGVRFWRWLEMQSDVYVDNDVYGAAIELLTINGSSLPEMEDLYQQALTRFPGTFSAYHLSPGAIVADRSKQTTLLGVPIILLQGILTARLLHGDSRNAYLALDTALRLYPDQVPPRFFQVFLEERSFIETYTVFALACRGGILLPTNHFVQILGSLKKFSDLSSLARHTFAVRSMLTALYLFLGAGGKVSRNNVSEFVIVVTQFLRLKGQASLSSKDKENIVREIMEVIRSLLIVFARYGIKPRASAFNAIIMNLGGFGGAKQVIGVALADMQALGIEPDEVTRRCVLGAAGVLGDGKLATKAWNDLVQTRAKSERTPDVSDFHVFTKAAAATGEIEFAKLEFEKFQETIPSSDQEYLLELLSEGNPKTDVQASSDDVDPASILKEIRSVSADLEFILAATEGAPKGLDFCNKSLPMTLSRVGKGDLSEQETRRLYDYLTTDTAKRQPLEAADQVVEASMSDTPVVENLQPAFAAPDSPATSLTNIPFDTLRYENWKTMNYLLELSSANDVAFLSLVDAAIEAGTVPPKRQSGLNVDDNDFAESHGISDAVRASEKSLSSEELQERRDKILRLRL